MTNSASSKQAKPLNAPLVAGILLFGAFISFLNETSLTTALPSIMKELHISAPTAQWLTTAFMLTTGIMIPMTAFLIERFSTRAIFFISMGFFTVGTFLGAIAPNFGVLLSARVIQAIGAGIILPLIQTVFMTIFPQEKRGFVMGILGVVISFAPAVGPTLSGWIIQSHPWRDIFYIVLPIAILDLIIAFFALQNVKEHKKVSLDVISVILSALAFGGLLLGFSNGGNDGWTNFTDVLLPLIVGVIALIFFTIRQLRLEAPLLDLRVFKNNTYTFATIIIMIAFAGFISSELIVPMYIQEARGYSAFDSGLILLPGALLMAIMSPITGKLFDIVGGRVLAITGLALLTIGTGAFMFLTATTSIYLVSGIFAFRLLGISIFMMPSITITLNALKGPQISHGAAINSTLRQIAGSLGTSILITVMTEAAKNSGAKTPQLALIHGVNTTFVVSTAATVIALLLAIFILKDTRKKA